MRLKKVFEFHHGLRTPNEAFFSPKSRTFRLGQTNWTDIFFGTDYGHPERAFFQKLETFGLGQTNWAEIL